MHSQLVSLNLCQSTKRDKHELTSRIFHRSLPNYQQHMVLLLTEIKNNYARQTRSLINFLQYSIENKVLIYVENEFLICIETGESDRKCTLAFN